MKGTTDLATRVGKYTLLLPSRPSIIGYAAVVGKAEGEGPLAKEFDYCYSDDTIDGCPSWEKAESALKDGKEIEFISIDELFNLLGTDLESLGELHRSQLSPMKVKRFANI